MMSKLRTSPFLLLFLALTFLSLLTLIPGDITLVGDLKTKKIDIIEDIRAASDGSAVLQEQSRINTAGIFDLGGNSDNLSYSAVISMNSVNENSSAFYGGGTKGTKEISIEGDLSIFIKALKNSSKETVRVAYWGDSAIEGDHITADFREFMQKNYGGNGVGFVAMNTQDASFRGTTKLTFSGDWDTKSALSGNPKELVGASGYVFIPKKDNSWAQFEGTFRYQTVREFNTARLFYTDASGGSVKGMFGKTETSKDLTKGGGVKVVTFSSSANEKLFKLTVSKKEQAKFFGVSLEKGNGVYIDNFPLRGDDGMSILRIQGESLKGFQDNQKYKLLIVHFGLNVLDKVKDFDKYEKDYTKVIDHLKTNMPGANILIVSVGDRSQKKGNKFITHPNVLKLVEVQRKVAKNTGVAFWNLFEAMGGEGAMEKWVNQKPALASQDYTHFTEEGAKEVASLLFNAIKKLSK